MVTGAHRPPPDLARSPRAGTAARPRRLRSGGASSFVRRCPRKLVWCRRQPARATAARASIRRGRCAMARHWRNRAVRVRAQTGARGSRRAPPAPFGYACATGQRPAGRLRLRARGSGKNQPARLPALRNRLPARFADRAVHGLGRRRMPHLVDGRAAPAHTAGPGERRGQRRGPFLMVTMLDGAVAAIFCGSPVLPGNWQRCFVERPISRRNLRSYRGITRRGDVFSTGNTTLA